MTTGRPGLGVSLSAVDPDFLERVLPLVDYLEVDPELVAEHIDDRPRIQSQALELIADAARHVPIIIHGTGLSLGSHNGYNDTYLRLLDELLTVTTPCWHSEHLGYTHVDGEFLGTMLTLPRTAQTLDMVCTRISEITARYSFPFLLENIIRLLPDEPAEYTEAAFLNAIVERTGCGLLLDLYNVECDSQNNGFDIPAFFDELSLEAVREIHLACGEESDGLLLDVHAHPTRECTVTLAREVSAKTGWLQCITFELLKDALAWVGLDGVELELRRLRAVLLP